MAAVHPEVMALRFLWAQVLLAEGHPAGYYYLHFVWTDFCSSVLPRSKKKAAEQALARKGKKGWVSDDAKGFSRNLKGPKECLAEFHWTGGRRP